VCPIVNEWLAVLHMSMLAQSLRTAILAALATGFTVADELPLRNLVETSEMRTDGGSLAVLATEIPVPWWRESIRSPLGLATKTIAITADDAVIESLSQSPDIQVFNVQPQIERTEITRQQAAFDWSNFMESAWIDRSDPVGNTLTTGNGDPRFKDQLLSAAGGVRKTTTSGAALEVAERVGTQRNNSLFLLPNPQSTSRLELTLTQPLMAGRGESYNLRRVVEARLLTDGSQAQSIARIQDYLLRVHQGYWELYRARAIFLQRKNAADRAAELAQSLALRVTLDTTGRQLVRSQTAAAQRRAELMNAASAADLAAIELRRLVGISDSESELIPMQSPSISVESIDQSVSLQTALSKRQEVAVVVQEIRLASVRLGASKNELLPTLDLIAGAYVSGLTPNQTIGNAFANQFSDGRPTYNLGLAWERPVGNRASKSTQFRRQLEMQEALSRYETAVQDVRRDVEIAVMQIHLTYRQLLQRHEALIASQAEEKFLLDRWNTAPNSDGPAILLLEDLINAQSTLSVEENATVTAETEHALAQVRYLKATGTLLQSSRPISGMVFQETPDENAVPMQPSGMIESEFEAPSGPREIDSPLGLEVGDPS